MKHAEMNRVVQALLPLIPKKGRVAITGPTGSGKTWLCECLMRELQDVAVFVMDPWDNKTLLDFDGLTFCVTNVEEPLTGIDHVIDLSWERRGVETRVVYAYNLGTF